MSDLSEPLVVLSAYTPYQPQNVATKNVGTQIEITWVKPDNGGSPITGYNLYIDSVEQVAEPLKLKECTNVEPGEDLNFKCVIDMKILTDFPYQLGSRSEVIAQVSAINSYGESKLSLKGYGAVM
jgi:hypothetical protein